MKGICPNCEKITDQELISRVEEIIVRNIPIEVQVEYNLCNECGLEFRDPKTDNDPLEAAYSEYRKHAGLLMPEEIREFRKSLGLTQRELAGDNFEHTAYLADIERMLANAGFAVMGVDIEGLNGSRIMAQRP